MFEEVKRGTVAELLQYYTEHQPKGEIVIVVAGAGGEAETDD
jgi:16S rRNA (cytidine1402-2'-O)-methyltransferase